MPTNFYNVILNLHKNNKLNAFTIQSKKYKKSQDEYILIEVPTNNNVINISGITLIEQHITVPANPFNKESYHFTANFSADKQEYKLHLYFNAYDKQTQIVYRKKEGNTFVTRNFAQLNEEMQNLANIAQKRAIQKIKSIQYQLSQELELQYENNCQKINSTNSNTSTKDYKILIDEQIEIAKKLESIEPREFYKKLQHERIKYLNSLSYAVINNRVEKSVPTKAPQETEVATKSEIKIVIPVPNKLQKLLIAGNKILLSLNHSLELDLPQIDKHLFAMQQEIMKLSQKHSYTDIELIDLNKMIQTFEEIAKKEAVKNLNNKNYNKVNELKTIHSKVFTKEKINEFIINSDHESLNFALIAIKDLDLNTFQPTLGTITFLNIDSYINEKCKTISKEDIPDFIKTINILLNEKMSPVQETPNEFPFIFNIIENEKHPLREWFFTKGKKHILSYDVLLTFVTILEIKENSTMIPGVSPDTFLNFLNFLQENLKYYKRFKNLPNREFPEGMFENYLSIMQNFSTEDGLFFFNSVKESLKNYYSLHEERGIATKQNGRGSSSAVFHRGNKNDINQMFTEQFPKYISEERNKGKSDRQIIKSFCEEFSSHISLLTTLVYQPQLFQQIPSSLKSNVLDFVAPSAKK